MISDAAFYFLPLLLANSAAKTFSVNPYIAMAIAGALVHPTFIGLLNNSIETGNAVRFLAFPVTVATYSSSVVPIILAVWFMSYVEPFIDKIVHKSIKLIMVPLLTLAIVAPVTLVLLGPLGALIGSGLGDTVTFLNEHVSWLAPTVVGILNPLLVMTGMHYVLISLGINSLATIGIDTVVGPGMLISNVSQGAAAFAVAVKTKNSSVRQLAISSGISALLGITEPVLYGISLRFKKPLISAMVGGGLGGLFIGVMNVGRYAQVAPSLVSLPSYIGPDGFSNFIYAIIGCIIAFSASFIIQLFLGIEDPEEEAAASEIGKEVVLEPDQAEEALVN
ncbi:PTS transporter subunit EIIC [Enterococcus casseliflavus]|uniref:PTS transporter subunit EIIC n=1 Tax=Enterococcus casseliflavus TaxID=37734 RepID=UPI0039A404DA